MKNHIEYLERLMHDCIRKGYAFTLYPGLSNVYINFVPTLHGWIMIRWNGKWADDPEEWRSKSISVVNDGNKQWSFVFDDRVEHVSIKNAEVYLR